MSTSLQWTNLRPRFYRSTGLHFTEPGGRQEPKACGEQGRERQAETGAGGDSETLPKVVKMLGKIWGNRGDAGVVKGPVLW